jgi:Flp pilus assembly protein CpaB
MSESPGPYSPSASKPRFKGPQGNTVLLVVAIVLALVAVVLVNLYVQSIREERAVDTFTVFRLAREVSVGDEVDEGMLEEVQVPEELRDSFANAVRRENGQLLLSSRTFGRSAPRLAVLTHDLLLGDDVMNTGLPIPRGYRGFAMPVDPRRVPPALSPGSHVDIEGEFRGPPGTPIEVLPVMENVRVLAVGARNEGEDQGRSGRGSYSTITILVQAGQDTQLAQINNMLNGGYWLHLRSPEDLDTPKLQNAGVINPQLLDRLPSAQ